MSTDSSEIATSQDAERFRVGVEVNGLRGGGTLWVTPGLVVLEMDRPTRALSRVARVAHTDPDLVLVTAWLIPPWFNTSVALHDDAAWARAVTWVGARRRLRDALVKSGFKVLLATTRFSRDVGPDGGRLDRPLPVRNQPWWLSRRLRVGVAIASVPVAVLLVVLVSQSAAFIAIVAAAVVSNVVAIFWR